MQGDSFPPPCPVCGSAGQVYKFSQVYVSAITAPADRSPADEALLGSVFGPGAGPVEAAQFAPPAEPAEKPRLPHPDALALALGAAALMGLFLLFNGSPERFWRGLMVVGALGAGYLLFRGRFIFRYARARQAALDAAQRSARAAARWAGAYYCAADRVVFDPARGGCAALEDAPGFLLND